MSQEILPPVRSALPVRGRTDLALRARPLPPGSHVPSGHWWVFVDGAPGAEGQIIVNGSTLIFPRGIWFVCENHRCIALRHSHEPMQWLDGFDLWEKVIGKYGAISERNLTDKGASQ